MQGVRVLTCRDDHAPGGHAVFDVELNDLRHNVTLGHAGLDPLRLHLPESSLRDGARGLDQLDFILGLGDADLRQSVADADNIQTGLLEGLIRSKVHRVHGNVRRQLHAIFNQSVLDLLDVATQLVGIRGAGHLVGDSGAQTVGLNPRAIHLGDFRVGANGLIQNGILVREDQRVQRAVGALPVIVGGASGVVDILAHGYQHCAAALLLQHILKLSQAGLAMTLPVDTLQMADRRPAIHTIALPLMRLLVPGFLIAQKIFRGHERIIGIVHMTSPYLLSFFIGSGFCVPTLSMKQNAFPPGKNCAIFFFSRFIRK